MPKKGKGRREPSYKTTPEIAVKFETIIRKTKTTILPGIPSHWPIRRDRVNQVMTWPGMETVNF